MRIICVIILEGRIGAKGMSSEDSPNRAFSPLAFGGGMWYHFSVFDSGNR